MLVRVCTGVFASPGHRPSEPRPQTAVYLAHDTACTAFYREVVVKTLPTGIIGGEALQVRLFTQKVERRE